MFNGNLNARSGAFGRRSGNTRSDAWRSLPANPTTVSEQARPQTARFAAEFPPLRDAADTDTRDASFGHLAAPRLPGKWSVTDRAGMAWATVP